LYFYYYFLNNNNNLFRIIFNNLKRDKYNFARFDIIFLLKQLIKVKEVNFIIYKNKIVKISLTFTNENNIKYYVINFRDSY